MRYETIKVEYEDGLQEFLVVDNVLDIQVAVLPTREAVAEFKRIRELIDKVNSK